MSTSGVGLLIMLSEFFLRLSCFSCGELTWHIRYAAYYKLYHFLYTRTCLVGGHTSPRHARLRHTLWRCFWPPQSVARFAFHLYGETVSGQGPKQQLYACGSHSCGVAKRVKMIGCSNLRGGEGELGTKKT